MRILPHLDDVGVTAGSVMAWRALRRAGVVLTGSVMLPCPYYPMARQDWQDTPDQDLGIHITLTSEWSAYRWRPLMGARGGLVDNEGFLHRRPEAVLAHADPMAVADEIEAQIDRALADGLQPSHLDAHMGVALLPPFVEALVEAGKRHGIPVLACRDMAPLIKAVRLQGVDTGYLRALTEEAKLQGWPVFDRFLIGFCPETETAERYFSTMIAEAGPGLHFLAMHADEASEMAAFAPHQQAARHKEFALFGEASSRKVFGDAEIVSWRAL